MTGFAAIPPMPGVGPIGIDVRSSSNRVVISWEAIPGKQYQVRAASLLDGLPWQTLTSVPLFATNNLIRFRTPFGPSSQFFQVLKVDTDPPEIWRLKPASNGIAVSRQSQLKVDLRDETGVDPASVRFTLGTNAPLTLQDSQLSYTNGTVVYTPSPDTFLGQYGETVRVTLAVSDTLGHRTTNSWPFELELMPVLADNVIVISPASTLQLAATNGDTFVFTYTGPSSGLTNGHIVVGTDPAFPYQRTVVSVTEELTTHTVTLQTTQAALADILVEGSIHFEGQGMALEETGARSASVTDGISIPLNGLPLYVKEGVKVEVVTGRFEFDPDLSIDYQIRKPRKFDLKISADLKLDMMLSASWQDSLKFDSSQRIGRAARNITGFIPTRILIPIPLVVTAEFRAGLEGEMTGHARVMGGFNYSRSVAVGVKYRDGDWTSFTEESSDSKVYPVTWEASGSVRIRAYVEPKIGIYLAGLIGPTLNVKPYLELEANACVQPGQVGVDVSLFGGITSTLALEIRGWDKELVPPLPATELLNLRALLWHGNFAQATGPPPLQSEKLVWIPCGTFMMGSPSNEPARWPNEGPQTEVTLSRGFWMGKYEVTQGEYLEVMGVNPSSWSPRSGGGALH